MIKPTVARILLYCPHIEDHAGAPFAAIVTKVWEDGWVNIVVFPPWEDGRTSSYRRIRVPLLQDGGVPFDPKFEHCRWMDYQRGQAAKSDELVAALTARLNDQTTSIVALEARIDSLEAKNEFDFAQRRLERRIEALEAAEANRVEATKRVFLTTPALMGNGMSPAHVGVCVETAALLEPKA